MTRFNTDYGELRSHLFDVVNIPSFSGNIVWHAVLLYVGALITLLSC